MFYIMKIRNIFALTFFLVSFSFGFAQEKEYIVTNSNDTIYGTLKRKFDLLDRPGVNYIFRDEQEKKRQLDPAEIKLIRSLDGVDGNSYIATAYGRWYAKRIIEGRIEVYQTVDSTIFYVSKDGSDLEFKNFGGFGSRKTAHAEIRPLFVDNPEILEEFDTLKGSHANILYIIQKYNDFHK